MATSPIYNWPEPDNTDLVKNGALAIRTLGNAIDTTMGTMVAKTIIDAKGDLIAGSAADTALRLAVGANDTVLTADSTAATGLKWATPLSGGMTLINTPGTALTGASVTVSSIPATYKHLFVIIEDVYQASPVGGVYLRMNGDAGTFYYWSMMRNINTTLAGRTGSSATEIDIATRNGSTNTNYKKGQIQFWIPRYTNTTPKAVHTQSYDHDDTNTAMAEVNGVYVGTSAVSSLTIRGDFNFSGGTIYVYGVN